MNNLWQRLTENFVPFIMLGIAVSLIIGFFIMFSYILLWGFMIGVVLWIASAVKEYFFPNENNITIRGRIIEYKNNRRIEK
jgi:hypothetical protein